MKRSTPTHRPASSPGGLQRLLADNRGAVFVEYITLIATVALGASVAFVTLGVALVRNFEFVRDLILVPFP